MEPREGRGRGRTEIIFTASPKRSKSPFFLVCGSVESPWDGFETMKGIIMGREKDLHSAADRSSRENRVLLIILEENII